MATENTTSRHSALTKTSSAIKTISQSRTTLIGILILLPMILGSIFAPMVAPYSPTETHPGDAFESPSQEYIFGTDNYGRDIFSRVLMGGRTSLFMGFSSIALSLLIGVPLGMIAGYYGKYVDEVVMRSLDVLMSFPTLLLALMVLSVLGSSTTNAILAVGFVYSPRIARVVRGSTLQVKNEEFIEAAESRGESGLYVMFREILPNIKSPIIVEASIRIGFATIVAVSLSFLGLGAQPPTPSWGLMISEARNYIYQSVWFLIWPSVVLSASVIGFNLLGDGLRDITDSETME